MKGGVYALERVAPKLTGRLFWWERHRDRHVLKVLIDHVDTAAVIEVRPLSARQHHFEVRRPSSDS
jgi:hypothetical protein